LLRCVSTLLYTSRSPGQICIGGITTMELRRAWEELLSELLHTGTWRLGKCYWECASVLESQWRNQSNTLAPECFLNFSTPCI
jgi:hypothetical protein